MQAHDTPNHDVAANQEWADHPLAKIDSGDRSLIVDFVLCSGSLKALAKQRGVSYPTIRARLNRVIDRLRSAVEERPRDPLNETLADLVERGELSPRGAKQILESAKQSRATRPGQEGSAS